MCEIWAEQFAFISQTSYDDIPETRNTDRWKVPRHGHPPVTKLGEKFPRILGVASCYKGDDKLYTSFTWWEAGMKTLRTFLYKCHCELKALLA